VAVIGAGTMGAGIARVAAEAGHEVFLFDSAPGAVDAALADMEARLDRSVEKGRRSQSDAHAILKRIRPGTSWHDAAAAGLAIEAIVEDLRVKQGVLAEVETALGPDAVIATNTSSLSVTAIAAALRRPDRVVGMHFFNPAPVMPLVEVVRGEQTESEVVDLVVATAAAWGKTPVRCRSTPGFIVNRVARPFYGEALRLLEEGVADASTIDAVVAEAGGFPMGPFTLMDLVGLDVNLAVSTSVYQQTFHDPRFAPNVLQQARVDAGHLGRKTGRGFHAYGPDAVAVPSATCAPAPPPEAVAVHGPLGWAGGIVERLRAGGVRVETIADAAPGHLVVGATRLVPTDGTTATDLATGGVLGTADVAVFDLVGDWSTAGRVAVAVAAQAGPDALTRAAGLFQVAGLAVSPVEDVPGLILMRIVSQLASVAADAVTVGVASAPDVDTAMRLGTNYPRGPLEWADQVGVGVVVAVLDHLRDHYGEERYRVASALRRALATGTPLSTSPVPVPN
jgi:3-hydroxybutyryl-CoA dehydrogenase